MAGPDYAKVIPDIQAPVKGGAGESLIAASESQARGIKIAGQAKADMTTFLGTSLIAAGKGKLEADAAKEINSSLDKLQGSGTEATQAQKNLDYLGSDQFAANSAEQLAMLKEQSGGLDDGAISADFMKDVKRYADAQRQGIMTRDEVLTRVSAAVKKYSAMMPGWASDFRKLGADMTGIDRLDVYGVHQALTTKSAQEKQAEQMQAAQLEAIKQIAAEQGVLPNQVTPQMLQVHYQAKQLEFYRKNIENKLKVDGLGREQSDELWSQAIATSQGKHLAGIYQDLNKLTALNADPAKAADAAKFGLELSSKIEGIGLQLEAEIGQMRASPTNPLSSDTAAKRVGEIRATVKTWQEGVKTIEGRNMLLKMAENSKNNLQLFDNSIRLANPYIESMNILGMQPSKLFELYMTVPRDEFIKRIPGGGGAQLADAMAQVLQNPAQHAGIMAQIALGKPIDINAVAQVDRNLATIATVDMIQNVKEWAKDGAPTQERKTVWVNNMAKLGSTLNLSNPTSQDLKVASELVGSDTFQAFVAKLSPQEKAQALTPLVMQAESTVRGLSDSLKAQIEAFNSDSITKRSGWTMTLKQNPVTGLFEVDATQKQPATATAETGGGAFLGGVRGMGGRGPNSQGVDGRDAIKQAQALATRINQSVEVFTMGARLLDNKLNVDEVRTRVGLNLSAEHPQSLLTGETLPTPNGGNVPKNTEKTSINLPKALEAVKFSEKSGPLAVSAKGARGEYQLMEATAKEHGLVVDPKAGVDERSDTKKAEVAAGKELSRLYDVFKGDMNKVAAGYNAGMGNVQKAIAKATKLGIPDQWVAFMPKPEETLPYIQRFLSKYQG
jgi:hypothetical protein